MMQRTEFGKAIAGVLKQLGAVKVRVGPKGIASHWRTEVEARVALEKFRELGLDHSEHFPDNGLYAAFAKFPTGGETKFN